MATAPAWMFRQSAVIPYRYSGKGLRVLLVTSRRSKRWVPPKGVVERGMSSAESAAKEAMEEAGVEGDVDDRPLGSYRYQKWRGMCTVEVYAMEVCKVWPEWLESKSRDREWMSAEEAARRVNEKGLKKILIGLSNRLSIQPAAVSAGT